MAQVFTVELEQLRRRTSWKWGRYGPDVLPAWVAEMDAEAAPVIRERLAELVAASDFGYPPYGPRSGIGEAFAKRAETLWGWLLDPTLVHVLPNVMTGVAHAIRAFTQPGDPVVVTTPIYPPFLAVVPLCGRRLVEVPLTDAGRLDLEGVRRAFATERARMLLLCHPHNPSGHVLARSELAAISDIILEHRAWLVSDEIHAELTYAPRVHLPAAALTPELAARTVTLNSSSKTFNLPGLRCAVAVTGTGEAHAHLGAEAEMTLHTVGSFGIAATLAAWSPGGDEWLAACLAELSANRDHLVGRVAADLPGVLCREPEATYLAWLDCRATPLGDDPARFFRREAYVALGPGGDFGTPGLGHVRLNFATSRPVLDTVIDRMATLLTPA